MLANLYSYHKQLFECIQYDEFFSNDAEVCQSIGQLQQLNDFSFIDEFYGTGSDEDNTIESPEDVDVPDFQTVPTKTIAPGEAGKAPEIPVVEEAETAEPDNSKWSNLMWLSTQWVCTHALLILLICSWFPKSPGAKWG